MSNDFPSVAAFMAAIATSSRPALLIFTFGFMYTLLSTDSGGTSALCEEYTTERRYTMPRIDTGNTIARRILFSGNLTGMSRATGVTLSTLKRRRDRPGMLTLDELSAIAEYLELTPEEITLLIKERGFT